MPVPTGYTEDTFKDYMHGRLGKMSSIDALKWTVADGDYDEALNDTLFAYGQTDIALITGNGNIQLLRAYGRYFLWKSVAEATIKQHDYTHADSGATYKFSQMHEQAKEMMTIAADDIAALGGDVSGFAIESFPIVYTDDLYTAVDNSLDDGNEWSRLSS